MVTTKRLNIKNRPYYFHNDIINLKEFDPSQLNLDKKSSMDVNIYYIEYITTKSISDYENITSVNPLYLIINDVDGYIEENDKNKYLSFASTDNNKEVLKKYIKLWDEVKYHIQTLKFSVLTIIIRSVFEKDDKYYPQIFLDDCLYDKV